MDLNEAALELKRMEIIEAQIEHLQSEAENGRDQYAVNYAENCNEKAQELIKMLPVFSQTK